MMNTWSVSRTAAANIHRPLGLCGLRGDTNLKTQNNGRGSMGATQQFEFHTTTLRTTSAGRICGEMRFVRDYHSRLIRGMMKGRVTHSPFRDGHDWKTSGRPRGC